MPIDDKGGNMNKKTVQKASEVKEYWSKEALKAKDDKENLRNQERGFRRAFYITAGKAGLKVVSALSDDKCCRLLAWLYVYGAANEDVIFGKLTDAIFYAQGRLNLLGGEEPNAELLPIFWGYMQDHTLALGSQPIRADRCICQ
jgi:hypothetical protein